jgi:hypothetical protein
MKFIPVEMHSSQSSWELFLDTIVAIRKSNE